MTLNEFIISYDSHPEYELEIVDYIPYEQKLDMCKSIINATTNTDLDEFEIDSCLRNVFYKMTLINLYTNIDIDFDHIIDEYDMLESRNLTDDIIHLIALEELRRFDMLMECLLSDLRTHLSLRRNRQ